MTAHRLRKGHYFFGGYNIISEEANTGNKSSYWRSWGIFEPGSDFGICVRTFTEAKDIVRRLACGARIVKRAGPGRLWAIVDNGICP